MSIKLVAVLMVLMVANQIIGVGYGSFLEGFQPEKLKAGIWKCCTILAGYGAIAKYFVKIIDKLKQVLGEPIENNIKYSTCQKEKNLIK